MAKTYAWIFGIIFLLVGVLGFFPNSLVGSTGFFQVNMMHTIVHLLSGIILVWIAAKSPAKSAGALKVFGVIYFLVAVLGFFMVSGSGSVLGMAMNSSDNWLHLILGVVMFAVGAMGKSEAPAVVM